jgi:voltage-gated potassium channel
VTTGRLLRRLQWVAIAMAAVIAYGVAGYMIVEGWPFLDSLYMTANALTTVGFGEARPLDDSGRIFTITLLVAGVGVALIGISLVAAAIGEGEFGSKARRRRMDRRIEQLRDHFIVCAYGRVGRAAVRELQAAGEPFVVVDPKEDLRERLEQDGVLHMIDDCSSEPVLRRAGVDRARGLICAVDSDATNVYITLTARQLSPMLFIVARSSEPGSAERLERAGANRIVSPYASSGRHMVRMARDPGLVDVFDEGSRARRSIEVEERLVEVGSALAGRTVADAPSPILAVRRANGEVEATPAPTITLGEGDVVLLLRDERLG